MRIKQFNLLLKLVPFVLYFVWHRYHWLHLSVFFVSILVQAFVFLTYSSELFVRETPVARDMKSSISGSTKNIIFMQTLITFASLNRITISEVFYHIIRQHLT